MGEIAWTAPSMAERACAGDGSWRNERVSTDARSISLRRGGCTGVSRPSSTPAMVGCTPDSYIATQSAIPATRYAGPRHTRIRPSSPIATRIPAAAASATKSMPSE